MDLEAAEYLRDIVHPAVRDLSYSIFYDLLEIDSTYRDMISYRQYEC